MIHTGDCIEVMAGMDADSVDAIVTDPPYGLEFMGKEWDKPNGFDKRTRDTAGTVTGAYARLLDRGPVKYIAGHDFQAWCEAWGREALRVTKPGGYLLAFGGTRTHHRLVCGLEDAGWIIRDELDWIYASGFPKGKANLKPAHEPIVLARKPGPLQPLAIDACRIPGAVPETTHGVTLGDHLNQLKNRPLSEFSPNDAGRWPSNVLLSDPALFDEKNDEVVGSGATTSGDFTQGRYREPNRKANGAMFAGGRLTAENQYTDAPGGYARYFIVPKADRADREPVVRGQLATEVVSVWGGEEDDLTAGKKSTVPRENAHPTVKPVDLMRHLVRLVTPAGGTVLDCFLGSGSTALAAELEGFQWVGIEKEPEYVKIAEARLHYTQKGMGL